MSPWQKRWPCIHAQANVCPATQHEFDFIAVAGLGTFQLPDWDYQHSEMCLIWFQGALKELWAHAFPDTPFAGVKNQKWTDMGWQRDDPASDFRGAGFVALQNMLYMARVSHQMTHQHLAHNKLSFFSFWPLLNVCIRRSPWHLHRAACLMLPSRACACLFILVSLSSCLS